MIYITLNSSKSMHFPEIRPEPFPPGEEQGPFPDMVVNHLAYQRAYKSGLFSIRRGDKYRPLEPKPHSHPEAPAQEEFKLPEDTKVEVVDAKAVEEEIEEKRKEEERQKAQEQKAKDEAEAKAKAEAEEKKEAERIAKAEEEAKKKAEEDAKKLEDEELAKKQHETLGKTIKPKPPAKANKSVGSPKKKTASKKTSKNKDVDMSVVTAASVDAASVSVIKDKVLAGDWDAVDVLAFETEGKKRTSVIGWLEQMQG